MGRGGGVNIDLLKFEYCTFFRVEKLKKEKSVCLEKLNDGLEVIKRLFK